MGARGAAQQRGRHLQREALERVARDCRVGTRLKTEDFVGRQRRLLACAHAVITRAVKAVLLSCAVKAGRLSCAVKAGRLSCAVKAGRLSCGKSRSFELRGKSRSFELR
jgi:hypothetical protein